MKKLWILSMGVACFLGCFLGCSWYAEQAYWEKPWLEEFQVDLTRYEQALTEDGAEHEQTLQQVRECNMAAGALPKEFEGYIRECNALAVAFFKECYHVDVSEKMNALKVMCAQYPAEISETVGGSYSSTPELQDKLFLNSAILEGALLENGDGLPPVAEAEGFYTKMLRTVYLHEVIHYLGFADDDLFDHSIEGFTESLNEQLQRYHGISYESVTDYGDMKDLAAQLLYTDKEPVRRVLTENTFSMGAYFNEVMGTDLADKFDSMIFLLQKGYHREHPEIRYQLQYLVYEYQKAAGSGLDVWKENKNPVVPLFELWWYWNSCMAPARP